MLAPSVLCYSTQSISATGSEAHEVCFDRLLLGLCLGLVRAALKPADGVRPTAMHRDLDPKSILLVFRECDSCTTQQ
jgi:hypothetical protein